MESGLLLTLNINTFAGPEPGYKKQKNNRRFQCFIGWSPKEAHPGAFPFLMGGHNPP
jgi:hypothetical protein